MSYKLQLPSKEEYLIKQNNMISFHDKKSLGYMENIQFDDGLSIIKSNIQFNENYNINIAGGSKNIIFTFLLDGATNYNPSVYNFNIDAKKDHTSIVLDNNTYGIKKYAKNTHLKSIQLFLNEEYLNKLLLDEYSNHNIVKKLNRNCDFIECLKHTKIDLKTRINVNEIFNTSFEGSFNKLYIQSKILDILNTELKELLFPEISKEKKEIKFSNYDKEALYKAKNILIENMHNPPSIAELSKMIKLNEFKLKIGFKNFFNNTPYGLLFEYKMEKAKKLLESSEYNINEISLLVGYKHSYNFTNAFYKRFGIRPKELMKTRKYYY